MNDLERPVGTYLYGRRMYETMIYWETDGDEDPVTRDFAEIWRGAQKVVYSRTLKTASSGRTRIERELDAVAIERMKESSRTDITIGGAEIVAQAIAEGLVDESGTPGVSDHADEPTPDHTRRTERLGSSSGLVQPVAHRCVGGGLTPVRVDEDVDVNAAHPRTTP